MHRKKKSQRGEKKIEQLRKTYGSGRGAKIVGQSWKIPVSGRLWQLFDPPPQFAIPELPMRDVPMSKMTVPVTRGGKILLRALGEQKDMDISRNEQTRDVPYRSSCELTFIDT